MDFRPNTKKNITLYMDEGISTHLQRLKDEGISPSNWVERLINSNLKPIDKYADVMKLRDYDESIGVLLHKNVIRLLNRLVAEHGMVRVATWLSYIVAQEYLRTLRYMTEFDDCICGETDEHIKQIFANLLKNIELKEERKELS